MKRFKMGKKIIYIAIFAVTTLVWIYWSTRIEFENTIKLIKQSNNYMMNLVIEPTNTTCKIKYSTFLVILVTSYVGHVELRSAHRRAMPAKYLAQFNASRIFLLAKIPNRESFITQAAVKDESNRFGDILQGSFIENYRNLTLKHLMGLQWAATHCYKSSYILKVDDDSVFNLATTYELLRNQTNIDKNNFLMGYMLNQTVPKRAKQNKWYVTWQEYPRNDYPSYVSGWYYITTPSVAAKLCYEAIYHPYFWIDDILVTGLLTEALGIKLRQLPDKYWLEYYELLDCCLRDMVTKFIRCDYVVGPNGGRNNLIYDFNEAVRNCNKWNNCTSRGNNLSLNKACVLFRDRTIFSDGQPEVKIIQL